MNKNVILFVVVVLLASCTSGELPELTPPTAKATTPPTLTPTPSLSTPAASPLPTQLTSQATEPDYAAISLTKTELDRWEEYQEALGNALYERVSRVEVLCEWQIMGRDEGVVYVWTVCSGYHPSDLDYLYQDDIHAVISLGPDGEVQKVATVNNSPGDSYGETLKNLFPPDILAKFGNVPLVDEMLAHLTSRREHPAPPLIVLSATTTP